MKCVGTNKDGSPCKSNGVEATDGLCWIHFNAKKGTDPAKISIRAVEPYANGTIIGSTRCGIGEVIQVTIAQYERICRDNPHAFERI